MRVSALPNSVRNDGGDTQAFVSIIRSWHKANIDSVLPALLVGYSRIMR